ncbi:P-loop containing nucleoside triphosphate hydrolase protein [Hypoxylon sp. FL1857]|nr:P-loop containing nucleoside triphosphate hydrolase protein [Hypoxylon sp. FL1857]
MAKRKKKGPVRQTPETGQVNPGRPVNTTSSPKPIPSPSSINLATPVKPVNPVNPVDPITPPVEPASPINPPSQITEDRSSLPIDASVDAPIDPPVEIAEEFVKIQESNGATEGLTKGWGYGTDDKESQVHFFDTSFTRLSFEDSERNTSEVLAADFNAGSTQSADEGYEHISSEEQRAPDFSQYDQLPRLPPPDEPLRAGPQATGGFDVEKVIGAIQNGYSAAELCEYLGYYHKAETTLLKENLNAEVRGFPATFYVVETNNAELVRYWIKYGGDPNATHGILRFPLLAFAILRGARERLQATRTIETLLRLGASPLVIPAAYYNPFDRDLPETGPEEKELYDIGDGERFWCTPELRPRLAAALSLTQRYRLWQASGQDPPTGRERTLAIRKDAVEILGLQYTIIGQRLATWSLRKSFLVHLAMPFKKPLVLLFAGPRGHGKSELVNKLAYLLSLDVQQIDCSGLNGYDQIFGPKQPGQDYSSGSPLNDFLASKTKERSIVFMEEFDKTNQEIHKELLVPFDRGVYTDRRNGQKVDSSQTIWILSTSKFDDTISDFCVANGNLNDSDLRPEQYALRRRQLHRRIRNECIASFGAPLTSRITEIIPFLTFNTEEQALITDKYIMELESLIAGPVVKSENPDEDRLIGNVQLQIANNASVCSIIANEHYLPEFGASSISHGVDSTITSQLISRYLEDGDDFSEDQAETKYRIGTNEDNEVEVLPELSSDGTNGYPGLGYSWLKGR